MLAIFALMTTLAVPEAPAPEVRRAYEEARATAGRTSEDQVRLALWCEAHGLTRERLNHLAVAVLADPTNATARGLMGLVAYKGRFQRPEAVAEKAQADPILAEYDARRIKAPYTAEGQWSMGIWAEEHGLEDQARAHFTAVIRLDPTREAAWRRLGFMRSGASVGHRRATGRRAGRGRGRRSRPIGTGGRCWRSTGRCRLGPPGSERGRGGPGWRSPTRGPCPSIGRVFGGVGPMPTERRSGCSGRSTRRRRPGPWRSWPSPPGRPRPAAWRPRRSGVATLANMPNS